jgi:RNA polymerase sigma-70 factor, ECF subfamily
MPSHTDPERGAALKQIRRLIEQAIDELPDGSRAVFVMRDIEAMSVAETADVLALSPATVKTRLHRARRLLRRALQAQLASALRDTFPFDGDRCRRTTETVLARLGLPPIPAG